MFPNDFTGNIFFINGERGIRTLGTFESYNGLAICRFRPLSHLSNSMHLLKLVYHVNATKSMYFLQKYIGNYVFHISNKQKVDLKVANDIVDANIEKFFFSM